jgi:DNA-binding transcriptional regulator YdaS (Cro superfamily)
MNRGSKAKLRKVKGAIIIKDGTQYAFAARLGIRESFVSSVIQGNQILPESEKKVWSRHLGVPVEELFSEEK